MLGRLFSVLSVGLAVFGFSVVGHANQPIGVFTGVYGTVTVRHIGEETPLFVSVKDNVRFQDLIETHQDSRMRALLDDDTLLSLGEDSQLDISEHIYDPEAGKRSAVLRLVRGAIRALVTKMPGTGSRFEIHTDTAIAAARGTYFVVWVNEEGSTGIANIGDMGDVAFTAGGEEVVVKPGHYSMATKVGTPVVPLVIPPQGKPAQAIQLTEVRQNIAAQTPRQIVEAIGGVVEKSLPRPRFLRNSGGVGIVADDAFTAPAVVSGAVGAPEPTVTPPAVISGAVRSSGISNSGPGSFSSFSNSGPGSMNSGPGSLNSGSGSIGSRSGSNSGPH